MPEDIDTLKDIPDQLFFKHYVPSNWPIEMVDGKIHIPHLVKSEGRGDLFLKDKILEERKTKDPATDAAFVEAVLKRLDGMVVTVNHTKDVLAALPRETTPSILMAEPEGNYHENQWERFAYLSLRMHLEAAGANVETPKIYESSSNLYQQWTRDRYVIAPDGTALFHKPLTGALDGERNEASLKLMEEFRNRGIHVKQIDSQIEGGDILQHRQSNTVFVGIRGDEHSNEEYVRYAQELANQLGMQLKLVPKKRKKGGDYYHLDTLMSILPGGEIIVIPEGTDATGLANIHSVVPPSDVLEMKYIGEEPWDVSGGYFLKEHDKRALSTNIITINGNVFTPTLVPEMKTFVEAHGYRLFEGPYQIRDSGVHCQTNFIKTEKVNGKSDVSYNPPLPSGLPRLEYLEHLDQNDVTLQTLSSRTPVKSNTHGIV